MTSDEFFEEQPRITLPRIGPVTILVSNPGLTQVRDSAGHDFWVPTVRIDKARSKEQE